MFYSLGDFIFENETLLRLPSDNYQTYGLGSDAHVNDFNDARYDRDKSGFPADRLIWEQSSPRRSSAAINSVQLALHPITLGFGKSRSVRGRPQFADGELGQKILGDFVKLSADMGTRSRFVNGIGYVMLPTSSSQ